MLLDAGVSDCAARVVPGLLVCLVLCGERTTSSAAEGVIGVRTLSTTHFTIRSRSTATELQHLGERCESLRAELRTKWFEPEEIDHPWTPRCELVIHADVRSYLREVPGGERTVGSSWIQTVRGRVVTRRIDVRGDRDWFDGAMPHELTHVLLADRFVDAPMPRWAEEGLALLADPQPKQVLHDLNCRSAVAAHRQFRLVELFAAAEYPPAAQQLTFYGQSAALVRYLTVRGRPTDFIGFVERARVEGYDAALRRTYGIDGVAALEAAWLHSVQNGDPGDRENFNPSDGLFIRPISR